MEGHDFDRSAWELQAAGGATKPTSCPANSTCMVTAYSNSGLGFCMGHGTEAVACPDQ